jgi:glycosyltransferase involved in cell wall biosynthesis
MTYDFPVVTNNRRRPRVLMVGTSLQTKGGISSVVRGYLGSDLTKHFEVFYVPMHSDGSKWVKIKAAFKGYLRFLYLLVRRKPDIVHIHVASRASFFRKLPLVVLSKLARSRIIYHHHGGGFMIFYNKESRYILKAIIRWLLRMPEVIVALSEQWRGNLHSIDPNLPVIVLSNPVTVPDLVPKKTKSRIQILFMGRLGQGKGTHDLLEAARILLSKGSSFHITLCGDGDLLYWARESAELGVDESVEIRGWISGEAKKQAFSEADIYILPSYNEGLPMSILEAMAYGLPIVTTPVGGIPDAVVDGINGFLVPPGAPGILAARLRTLIANKSLREKMGYASREIVKERFELSKIINSLDKIYLKLMGPES